MPQECSNVDFRLLFESVPGLYLVLTPNLKIVTASDAYLQATMTTREEIIGRGIFDVFPDNPEDSQATGKTNLKASLERVLLKKSPDTMATQKYDIRRPISEGGKFEERFWSPVNYPIINKSTNKIDYIIHHVVDVTACAQLEQWKELEINKHSQVKENFQLMIEAVQDYAIFMLDPAGYITSWNLGAQRINGYSAEEVIGKHLSIFYTDTDKNSSKAEKELQEAREKGKFQEEGIRVHKDGSKYWVYVVLTALKDSQGNLRGFTKITRNITEQKEAEETLKQKALDLERSNKDLEQFAYVASHDLQEPLRMIVSYCQLLERRYKDKLDQEANEFINFVVDATKRMQMLITDLLSYSRIDKKNKNLLPTSCEEILDHVLLNLSVSIKESGAMITQTDLPVIIADSTLIGQLLQNLISNAIKYRTSEPPRVHIAAKKRENDWLFSVQDNGIGIDPQYHHRLFIIFQRLHSPTEYPGTGIGLALCKKIVERHGGTIWLDSQIGQGTTFYFTIPRKESYL